MKMKKTQLQHPWQQEMEASFKTMSPCHKILTKLVPEKNIYYPIIRF